MLEFFPDWISLLPTGIKITNHEPMWKILVSKPKKKKILCFSIINVNIGHQNILFIYSLLYLFSAKCVIPTIKWLCLENGIYALNYIFGYAKFLTKNRYLRTYIKDKKLPIAFLNWIMFCIIWKFILMKVLPQYSCLYVVVCLYVKNSRLFHQ